MKGEKGAHLFSFFKYMKNFGFRDAFLVKVTGYTELGSDWSKCCVCSQQILREF